MYKPIIGLETGIIMGYLAGEDMQFLQHPGYIACQKIFYTLSLGDIEEKIEQFNFFGVDRSRIVIVLEESEVMVYQKDPDEIIAKIRKAGFELAFRIGFYEFPDIIRVKRWHPAFVILEESVVGRLRQEPQLGRTVSSVVIFGKEFNYSVIAEGIRTGDVLQSVINTGVSYGQGEVFQDEPENEEQYACSRTNLLAEMRADKKVKVQNISFLRNVGAICHKGYVMRPDERAIMAYEMFEKNKECFAICIVDEEGRYRGILTKINLMHAFGGRYGYNLHHRNTVLEMANNKTLIVYKNFSIENVSRLAMERKNTELYDPVVVIHRDKYYGIVTVKDLLTASVSIEVEKANEANPLTALPGNRVIEQKIHQLIGEQSFFAIIYLDLDNFKAFNDAYGFPNGDRMIEMLAGAMKKIYGSTSFLGHVGGDDFVIITRCPDIEEKTELIIREFREKIRELYNDEDWERGYIIAQSRQGILEQFPIASISIAIVTNRINTYNRMMELTEQIVTAKKKAKQIEGNSVVIL